MWRQIAGLLTVAALKVGAAHFLRISFVAKSEFAFEAADLVAYASGMLFAFLGGWISRKYGFSVAVGVVYFGFWCVAIYSLNAVTGGRWLPQILFMNGMNMAVSILAAMAGACLGVLARNKTLQAAAT